MACSNSVLSLAALLTFGSVVWPGFGGTYTPWIVGVSSVVVLAFAWGGVECKFCR